MGKDLILLPDMPASFLLGNAVGFKFNRNVQGDSHGEKQEI